MIRGIKRKHRMYGPGCIIVGYQGVGKSSLSELDFRYIDLESSSFFVRGSRHDDWYEIYCKIALDLAAQGYRVFTSSHMCVREYFSSILSGQTRIPLFVCYPDVNLKDGWVNKLEARYNRTGLDKDRKAYLNAKSRFEENVFEMSVTCNATRIVIKNLDYDLNTEIEKAIKLENRSSK